MNSIPLRTLVLPGLALVLGSCATLGPDTKVPPPSAPAAFKNASAEITTQVPPPNSLEHWWQVFQDPTLDKLELQALGSNPGIAGAAARVEEARARLGVAGAESKISATASGAARLAGETSRRTLPIPSNPISYRDSGDSYRASFDASYELDLWGRVKRLRESASAGLGAAEADQRGVFLALSADLAQTYFSIRSLDAEDAILERTRSQRLDSIAVLQARHEAGFAPELDVHRARAELYSIDAERSELSRRRSQLVHALAVLSGLAPSDFDLPSAGPLSGPPFIPSGLPAQVLSRRPDLAYAEASLRARLAEVGVAEAARYPTIRLTGGAGFESADLGRLLDRPSQFWQLGPSFSLPLLDGGRTRANVAVAAARVEQARAEHRQRTLTALREVEDALVELRQQAAQDASLVSALDSISQAQELASIRNTAGFTNYLEVLDAQRTRLQYERTRSQLAGARLASTIRLIRSLGGGW